ncbi:MAG: DUF2997 domain-containing protein [Herpetosiphon sp.]|nr:DUF2997 domain-containing protein [Herpetosiphon sp.]
MSSEPLITVTIDDHGNVTIHVEGVAGSSCMLLTAGMEADLGGDVDHEYTTEYFEREKAKAKGSQYA